MDYRNRLTSLLIENSAMKRSLRNAEIRAEHERRGQPDKLPGHSLDRFATSALPAGRTEMNQDDYEPGTTEKNQAADIAGKQAAAARRRARAAKVTEGLMGAVMSAVSRMRDKAAKKYRDKNQREIDAMSGSESSKANTKAGTEALQGVSK